MSESTTADIGERTDGVNVNARHPPTTNTKLRWGAYLIGLSGIGFIANGMAMLYRVFFSAGFEAGVPALGGVTPAELAATNHELFHYVTHLHVNVAGLMVSAGIAMVALAWFGIRRGQRWAFGTAISIPVIFLAHSLPVHGTAQFSYDAIVHLGPGIVWLPALVIGSLMAFHGLRVENGARGEEAPDR